MINITINLGKLQSLKADAQAKADEITRQHAFRLQANAQINAPVDTGALRNSAYTQANPKIAGAYDVGFSAEYAFFQEFGTMHFSAQPFLRPAFKQEMIAWQRELKDIVE